MSAALAETDTIAPPTVDPGRATSLPSGQCNPSSVASEGTSVLYFLLSYAHGEPEDDEQVRRFFFDLSREVRNEAGLAPDQVVGYLDSQVPAGTVWGANLMSALCTCAAFVALCSRAYFKSKACGREWSVFTARLAAYQREHGVESRALIPLRWMNTVEMPELAARYQYADDDLGEPYRERGVRDLVRHGNLKDQYTVFVSVLAKRIVDVAERLPMPEWRDETKFDAVEPAFGGSTLVPSPPVDGARLEPNTTVADAGPDPTPSRPVDGHVPRQRERPILSAYEDSQQQPPQGGTAPIGHQP
jgi:hypothetical protein